MRNICHKLNRTNIFNLLLDKHKPKWYTVLRTIKNGDFSKEKYHIKCSTKKGGNVKLSNYANIRTGLVFSRKKANPDESNRQYQALNIKCVTDDGQIMLSDIEDYYASDALKKEYFTCAGDVLLRLSAPYTAVLITENEAGLLIPAHFAIIRTKKTLNPRYLHWWLTKNKKRFYQMASGGTMIGTISSGYIADMAFEPPSLRRQYQIAKLLELENREQLLLSELAIKKTLLIDATLKKIISEKEK